jgi:hypothetical protein
LGQGLKKVPWIVFEPLTPKKHFYPPKVKKVVAPASVPLIKKDILTLLEGDYENFQKLLDSRREQFIRQHNWEDEDSELCSSSSDSEHEYIVKEVLGVKTKKNGERSFLISFKYFEEPEWIKEIYLGGCQDLISEFLKS